METNQRLNVVQCTTLIILPILNGEIALSIPSRTKHAKTEISVSTNAVTAVDSTVRRTYGSRAARVVEHPSRTNRTRHSAPTVKLTILISLGNLIVIFWVCSKVCAGYWIARCYARYCSTVHIISKCHRPCCGCCIGCSVWTRHRRIQDNGRAVWCFFVI